MSIVDNPKNAVQGVIQGAMGKAIEFAPDSWVPGGTPDPIMNNKGLFGAPISRIDGPLKVQGEATFAAEFPIEGMVYASVAFSTVAKGRIATLDTAKAETAPGVVLVMTHRNAPKMAPMPMLMGQTRGPPVATICRLCRTTRFIGTVSRSRLCWPKRRIRPIMPSH